MLHEIQLIIIVRVIMSTIITIIIIKQLCLNNNLLNSIIKVIALILKRNK